MRVSRLWSFPITTNTYSTTGNLLTTKDPLNNTTTLTYTNIGQLSTVQDALNHTTILSYDTQGRLTGVTDANNKTTGIAYDARVRPTSVTNALNETTSFGYDLNNRLNKITHPDTNFITYSYDLAGRRTGVTDARNNTTSYGYDTAYRLTGITDPLNHSTTFGYDLMSNLTSRTDALGNTTGGVAAEVPNRVTILYDSFGKSSSLTKDWGFAALVEYGGKRILFDTGNNARIFEHNVKASGVDLRNLDLVVISHRHADHTSGLTYLLTVNPKVKIYVPDELWGLFARGPTNDFYRKDPSLPAEMRYYGGHPPEILEGGTPWPGANFIPINQRTEVAPGIFILAGVSSFPGTMELKELSLAIKSPRGIILIVGCSHPGVEHILQDASTIDPHINILIGGLHQHQKPDPEVERIAAVLHDQYKLERVAPGHCTGEPEFAALRRAFGDRYVYAGLGSVVELPGGKVAGRTPGRH